MNRHWRSFTAGS